jgi:hypothetical protein
MDSVNKIKNTVKVVIIMNQYQEKKNKSHQNKKITEKAPGMGKKFHQLQNILI